ncbi:MAG: TrpB-like pyridoxal phosphate-dependent enzyme [Candidatus Omnitrophica bacterium]|nr:TrpB-like pyridoxal phosphate-dependent enzyme [Candidatus Omnitrophota bacterium]
MHRKILLPEDQMPTQWLNLIPYLKKPPAPYLDPMTGQPVSPEQMGVIFPRALLEQEMSTEPWIDIPEPVLDFLSLWRPSPLMRAYNLEKALGTPAKIYYKNESLSPAGSHKPNTAVAQAYYNKMEGVTRMTTETGAGQWGSALALACNHFGLECMIYMVRVSYEQKPYRKSMMHVWGAEVVPSPSPRTQAGRAILEKDPDCPGSLGIAISEAVEDAALREDTKYGLGSVLNHVLLHQTVIGLEAKKQFEMIGGYPDIVIGCVGGGSNFAGTAFPFCVDKSHGRDVRIIAVEPTACPTMTKGQLTYDFGDTAKMTPLIRMHTLGHDFIPPSIHAGGLRYHGVAPLISCAIEEGLIEAQAVGQTAVFEAGIQFARSEGSVPAPEAAHAIRAVIDEALKAKEEGKEKTIFFNYCGHGHFDMASYDRYFAGGLEDYEYPAEKVAESLAHLPKVGG